MLFLVQTDIKRADKTWLDLTSQEIWIRPWVGKAFDFNIEGDLNKNLRMMHSRVVDNNMISIYLQWCFLLYTLNGTLHELQ